MTSLLGREDEVAPDRRDQCPGDGHKQEGVAVPGVGRRSKRRKLLLRRVQRTHEELLELLPRVRRMTYILRAKSSGESLRTP